ncbi:MAG: class I SAM-dependent methyltransferase [Bacteroidales bacterium]|nr:class I SAM-dependent methyltransferase [Bacteroidales bacterium]MDY0215847.1 class I SAM-dependent methyltransferase [Bacteroidales bacterium]
MSFWDEKYRNSEYIYGTHPNAFFREELLRIPPGILLLPAEGEGRNALFALENNWKVEAIDSSVEAQKKALKLCHKYTSRLNYQVHNLEEFNYPHEKHDAIALIYAHFDSDVRTKIHSRIISSLKPGGTLILEAFSKEQITFSSGGPKSIEKLYSLDEILKDFESLHVLHANTIKTDLKEGKHHNGEASVVRFVGKKSE